MTRTSVPMSPPPPPPDPPTRHHTSGGWRPQPDDDSPMAVAFRARRAERIAEAARDAIGWPPDPSSSPPDPGGGIRRSIAELKVIVLASEAAAERRGRVLLWALAIFGATIIASLASAAWKIGGRVRLVEQGDATYHVAEQRDPAP